MFSDTGRKRCFPMCGAEGLVVSASGCGVGFAGLAVLGSFGGPGRWPGSRGSAGRSRGSWGGRSRADGVRSTQNSGWRILRAWGTPGAGASGGGPRRNVAAGPCRPASRGQGSVNRKGPLGQGPSEPPGGVTPPGPNRDTPHEPTPARRPITLHRTKPAPTGGTVISASPNQTSTTTRKTYITSHDLLLRPGNF